jgi:hypothetical protein
VAAASPTLTGPLSVVADALPAGRVGSRYRAQLAAAGGAGRYGWALASGALPKGLTLNHTSGVISGTPTAPGSGSFTATVSDPGPPAQSGSRALKINITASLSRPNTLLLKRTIQLSASQRHVHIRGARRGNRLPLRASTHRPHSPHRAPQAPVHGVPQPEDVLAPASRTLCVLR